MTACCPVCSRAPLDEVEEGAEGRGVPDVRGQPDAPARLLQPDRGAEGPQVHRRGRQQHGLHEGPRRLRDGQPRAHDHRARLPQPGMAGLDVVMSAYLQCSTVPKIFEDPWFH